MTIQMENFHSLFLLIFNSLEISGRHTRYLWFHLPNQQNLIRWWLQSAFAWGSKKTSAYSWLSIWMRPTLEMFPISPSSSIFNIFTSNKINVRWEHVVNRGNLLLQYPCSQDHHPRYIKSHSALGGSLCGLAATDIRGFTFISKEC